METENTDLNESIQFSFDVKFKQADKSLDNKIDNEITQDLSSLNLFKQTDKNTTNEQGIQNEQFIVDYINNHVNNSDEHTKFIVENLLNQSMNSYEFHNYNVNNVNNLTTSPKLDYKQENLHKLKHELSDLDSASTYYLGKPKSNGFVSNKINPVLDKEFSYLNRNKLVNRRIAIKKQIQNSSGLHSFTSPYVNNNENISKLNTEFTLANPNVLYKDEDNSESKIDLNENNLHEVLNNTLVTASNNDELILENKNLRQRKWYTNEAKKFYRPTKSLVIIEKKGFKYPTEVSGPSPFSYRIPRRPPHERISPKYTIGGRNFKEKSGGGRTSWEKEWFNSPNPFIIKSNFNRELHWPAPNNYKLKSALGGEINHVYHHAPSHTIGVKLNNSDSAGLANKNSNGSSSFDIIMSREDLVENQLKNLKFLKKREAWLNRNKKALDLDVLNSYKKQVASNAPKVSFSYRHNGTILWSETEKTPGPGAYDLNKFKNILKQAPKYTQPLAKHELNSTFTTGPYATI